MRVSMARSAATTGGGVSVGVRYSGSGQGHTGRQVGGSATPPGLPRAARGLRLEGPTARPAPLQPQAPQCHVLPTLLLPVAASWQHSALARRPPACPPPPLPASRRLPHARCRGTCRPQHTPRTRAAPRKRVTRTLPAHKHTQRPAQNPHPCPLPSPQPALTGARVKGRVVVDVRVAQGAAGHRVAADADGRHRAHLQPRAGAGLG